MGGVLLIALNGAYGIFGYETGWSEAQVKVAVAEAGKVYQHLGDKGKVSGSIRLLPRTPKQTWLEYDQGRLWRVTYEYYNLSDTEIRNVHRVLKGWCLDRFGEPVGGGGDYTKYDAAGAVVELTYGLDDDFEPLVTWVFTAKSLPPVELPPEEEAPPPEGDSPPTDGQ